MNLKLARIISTGFYSGLSPVAAGTAGSLAYFALWWFLLLPLRPAGLLIESGVVLLLSLVGTKAVGRYLACDPVCKKPGDPGEVVIDEWAGMGIALLIAPPFPFWWPVLAFSLFRLLDIIKPWPIQAAENLKGAWGVMMDDLLAGLFAGTICCVLKATIFS